MVLTSSPASFDETDSSPKNVAADDPVRAGSPLFIDLVCLVSDRL
jgi:hypothetical protein